jgi:hypothetical protein
MSTDLLLYVRWQSSKELGTDFRHAELSGLLLLLLCSLLDTLQTQLLGNHLQT